MSDGIYSSNLESGLDANFNLKQMFSLGIEELSSVTSMKLVHLFVIFVYSN